MNHNNVVLIIVLLVMTMAAMIIVLSLAIKKMIAKLQGNRKEKSK